VASSKTRQRKLARAKMERQMARRAARVRRKRQIWAGIVVGVVVVLGITGTVWALGGFSSRPTPAAANECAWAAADKSANDKLKDVGQPPKSGEPRTGSETITITLDTGTVVGSIDLAKAPCTAASMAYLAGKKFFDNTPCHRLTTSGLYVLQCGDPSGSGTGGPAYTYANENVPAAPEEPSTAPSDDASSPPASTVVYPKGTLAMANSGADTNGSQFFIVYKDSPLPPNYTIFGTVTQGLDVVEKIAAGGAVDDSGKAIADGKPKTPVTLKTLTLTPAGAPPSAAPSASAAPSGSASPSASASAKS
jgi:peptidyl-prolyl cis-trans isomerase B (cyclophilin B)